MVDVSHGFGGFGNVWGAAILPYVDNDLVGWPIRAADLAPSYRHVLGYVPNSSEADDLDTIFPRFVEHDSRLLPSAQYQQLARALGERKSSLRRNGINARAVTGRC